MEIQMLALLHKTSSITCLFHYMFSPSWFTCKQPGQAALLTQAGRTLPRTFSK